MRSEMWLRGVTGRRRAYAARGRRAWNAKRSTLWLWFREAVLGDVGTLDHLPAILAGAIIKAEYIVQREILQCLLFAKLTRPRPPNGISISRPLCWRPCLIGMRLLIALG